MFTSRETNSRYRVPSAFYRLSDIFPTDVLITRAVFLTVKNPFADSDRSLRGKRIVCVGVRGSNATDGSEVGLESGGTGGESTIKFITLKAYLVK